MTYDAFVRHYGLWTPAQQQQLRNAVVAVGGVGGVGAAQALLLTKSGIGRIIIADRDCYQTENIVEQAFATVDAVGIPKVKVAAKEMHRHQDAVNVETIHGDLTQSKVLDQLAGGANLLFSGVDNPQARISLGRAALVTGIPFVVAANVGWSIFYTTYHPERGGYAAAFTDRKKILKDDLGFPIMDDLKTRMEVEMDWCIWTVAFSGYRREELRRFIRGDLSYFPYMAGTAFAAASLSVVEGIKCLLKIDDVVIYPDYRVIDIKKGHQLSDQEIRRRYASIASVWTLGERTILTELETIKRLERHSHDLLSHHI